MHHPTSHRRASDIVVGVALALTTALAVSLPVAAFNSGWTTPKRVFTYSAAPNHAMVVDSTGRTHIATERGSTGIRYITNTSGSWQECQLTDLNDRHPSIVAEGTVIHIAFARRADGQKGIYTASSSIPAPAVDCGLAITQRVTGDTTHPSIGAHEGKLSIAYRTASKKLKFTKGALATTPWTTVEVIDSKCCTSAPSLDLTTKGAARVAYGDGTSKADGLKYAVRGSAGWKKSKASGGRIKHVSMVLDKTPAVLGDASNAPKLAYIVKGKGTYLGTKSTTFARGKWGKRWFGRYWTPPDVSHSSNVTKLIYGGNGNLFYVRMSGAIWLPVKLSGSGRDVKPQLSGGKITFARNKGTKGIYFSQPK